MKKGLIVFGLLLFGLSAKADFLDNSNNVTMDNFWEKNGKAEEKIINVGSKIINANKLDKRIPFLVNRNQKTINAFSTPTDKKVIICTGILPYLDNYDELAFVMSHEIAHSLDAYDGLGKWVAMRLNSQQYEYKADLIGVDLMTKAGYNPVASIIVMNKFFPESTFDFGILSSHPKTSKRMFALYKYIYKKYPWALKTDMIHNVNYVNFTYSSEKEINAFNQREKERAIKREIPAL